MKNSLGTSELEEKSPNKGNNPQGTIPSQQIIPFKERLDSIIGDASVRSFSRKCGLAEKTLRNYIAGKQYPTLDRLALIAEASGRSMTWLVTGEEAQQEVQAVYESIDNQLLETSIKAIELLCKKRNIEISPKKKAQIIALVYTMSIEEKTIDESVYYQLIELAS